MEGQQREGGDGKWLRKGYGFGQPLGAVWRAGSRVVVRASGQWWKDGPGITPTLTFTFSGAPELELGLLQTNVILISASEGV